MKTNWLTHKGRLGLFLDAVLAISGCMPGAVFYTTLEPRGASCARDGQLFRVTQDVAELELDFIVETGRSTGSVSIEDLQTGEAVWRRDVRESVIFTQPVGPLKKGRPYLLRFTGTASEPTAITASSQSGVIREILCPAPSVERNCPAHI